MAKDSSIAVVIPVHNRRDELLRALRSVLHQSTPVQEIWVIDDASTIALTPFSELEHCNIIRYHQLEEKSNANVARNKGAELSNADFIAFLDSDDEWEVNYIEQCKSYLNKGHAGYFSQSKIFKGGQATAKISRPWEENVSAVNFLLDGGFAQTSSFIVDRDSFLKVQFDEELKRHQDFDFFVRYAKSFRWVQLPVCAVLVHWEENRKVTRDAASEMKFIQRNAGEIHPKILKRYLRMQYDYFFYNGSRKDYSLHQSMLFRVISELTFSDYKSFFKEKSWLYLNTMGLLRYIFLKLKG